MNLLGFALESQSKISQIDLLNMLIFLDSSFLLRISLHRSLKIIDRTYDTSLLPIDVHKRLRSKNKYTVGSI